MRDSSNVYPQETPWAFVYEKVKGQRFLPISRPIVQSKNALKTHSFCQQECTKPMLYQPLIRSFKQRYVSRSLALALKHASKVQTVDLLSRSSHLQYSCNCAHEQHFPWATQSKSYLLEGVERNSHQKPSVECHPSHSSQPDSSSFMTSAIRNSNHTFRRRILRLDESRFVLFHVRCYQNKFRVGHYRCHRSADQVFRCSPNIIFRSYARPSYDKTLTSLLSLLQCYAKCRWRHRLVKVAGL